MILTKDLIMIDPEDGHSYGSDAAVWQERSGVSNMKLPEVLKDFNLGAGSCCCHGREQ